jgi:hypothetical protein
MKTIATLAVATLMLAGCGGMTTDDVEETGHAAADVFASYDEGTSVTGMAWNVPLYRPSFDRTLLDRTLDLALPSAWAAACWKEDFSACTNSERVRTFDHCALGPFSLDGSVTLDFSSATCAIPLAVGDTITRHANFTLNGRRNSALTVSDEGGGQMIAKTADGWTYSVPGMHRVMTDAKGTKLFDISTRTTSDIVISGGLTRKSRVLVSGTLEIVHNLAGFTVDLTPADLTWDGTCNCPVSGKLTGTATGKRTGTAEIVITGCGTGTVTIGADTTTVNFDRCATL